jgi:hypothetical protein
VLKGLSNNPIRLSSSLPRSAEKERHPGEPRWRYLKTYNPNPTCSGGGAGLPCLISEAPNKSE